MQQERMSVVFKRCFVATLAVVSVLLIVLALYKLRDVALIVSCAGFLAYFLAWPIEWLLRRRVPHAAAVRIVCYTMLLLVLGTLGPLGGVLFTQTQTFVNSVPGMLSNLSDNLYDYSFTILPGHEIRPAEYIEQLVVEAQQSIPSLMTNVFNYTQSVVSGTAAVVVALLVIPLIALYLLLDGDRIRKALMSCFPARMHDDLERALTAVNRSLSGYIYSKTMMALFVGIAMALSLTILGVPFSVLLGILACLGEFIPVVGAWVAFIPTALAALTTGPVTLLWVIIITIIVQLVQNYFIAPKLMSETMNLHPLTVLIAMIVGGTIGGFAGLVLAIPVAAAGKVFLNVFILRRTEPGIPVPAMDLIAADDGSADFQETTPEE